MASNPRTRLLIATGNPGKTREYQGLLRGIPFELVSLGDLGISHEVDETGGTFEENSWLKASEYAAISGMLTLADDSGMEVDALSGEPGVRSARYGGDSCNNDQDRVALLLKNLEGVPWDERTARFRCVITIAKSPPVPLYERWGSSRDPRREEGEASPFRKGGPEGNFRASPTSQSRDAASPFPKGGPEGDFRASSANQSRDAASPFRKGGPEGDFRASSANRSNDAASPCPKRGPEGDFRASSANQLGDAASPFRKGGPDGDFSPPPQQPTLITQTEGSVSGMIQYNPQGDDGFGYDPVFYLPSYGKTIAQLSLDDKNRISHRADAARKAVKFLDSLTTNS